MREVYCLRYKFKYTTDFGKYVCKLLGFGKQLYSVVPKLLRNKQIESQNIGESYL